jgi:putative SOS response-associated peptidase YedK
MRERQDLIAEFEIEIDASEGALAADYNVAPTKTVPLVMRHHGRRELRAARWGLVPSWASDTSIGSRLINARAETVADKPAFRAAFERRRCLLPADGYFEWGEDKTPFFIHPPDGGVMAMAGLFEWWRRDLLTCTVITTRANDELSHIHDRMPVLLSPSVWEAWLEPDVAIAPEVLRPAPPGLLTHHEVGRAVNNVRNNGAELVSPVSERGIYREQSVLRLF